MASRIQHAARHLSSSSSRMIVSPFSRYLSSSRSLNQAATDPDEHPSNQREAQKDRHKMDTEANEYAKSGTDASAAAQSDAAFNPNSPSDPQEAKKVAGQGNKVNPLDASPANPELSKGTSESDQTNKKDQLERK